MKEFSGLPILALTATATSETITDIVKSLNMQNVQIFTSPLNIQNLRFQVFRKSTLKKKTNSIVGDIFQWMQREYGENLPSGIIYCFRQKDCDELAQQLWLHHGNEIIVVCLYSSLFDRHSSSSLSCWVRSTSSKNDAKEMDPG